MGVAPGTFVRAWVAAWCVPGIEQGESRWTSQCSAACSKWAAVDAVEAAAAQVGPGPPKDACI
jgi:hypothetical protein